MSRTLATVAVAFVLGVVVTAATFAVVGGLVHVSLGEKHEQPTACELDETQCPGFSGHGFNSGPKSW